MTKTNPSILLKLPTKCERNRNNLEKYQYRRQTRIPLTMITVKATTNPGINAVKPRETPSGTDSGIFNNPVMFHTHTI